MRSTILGKAAGVQLFFIVAIEATSFGCRNTLISDEWRKAVLDFHNRNRQRVAEGKQRTGSPGTVMKAATKMYYLNWDCDIENNAFLSSCNGQMPIPLDYGVNKGTFKMNKKCNINDNTMAVLKGWWDQATAADLSQNSKFDETKQKEFGAMAYGEAKGFACSYSNCGGSTGELLCLYSAKAQAAPNNPLYTEGNVCADCPADDPCTSFLCTPKTYTVGMECLPFIISATSSVQFKRTDKGAFENRSSPSEDAYA
ncbi:hypothetical protein Y032_0048g1585 [Ancylostoma ceylanicum]|uniref:SCP domain-containing protein n=2 Tax=Ancylostoma ceylanicum TaxID=53326 RepID=A0A016UBU7_9BILA|nr:hypothetical protein Y032_0048g1585 [Ancylostoma ceylanicum]